MVISYGLALSQMLIGKTNTTTNEGKAQRNELGWCKQRRTFNPYLLTNWISSAHSQGNG